MARRSYAALAVFGLLVAGLALLPDARPAAAATPSDSVLILGTSVSGGDTSLEANAVRALGLDPVVVDAATWRGMTAVEFGSYRAIVLGDATCGGDMSAAEATTGMWGPEIDGNTIIVGTDPVYHASQGGSQLTNSGIAFAAADAGKTGAYITLSCYYHGTASSTPVPLLDGLSESGFTVTGVGCYDNAHIVAEHPALAGLSDASLSNWGCSVHEAFDSWPGRFQVLALARDFGAAFTASDGTVGTPYILASGSGLRSFPLSAAPLAATVPVGSTHTITATLLDASTREPATGVPLRAYALPVGGGVSTDLGCDTALCATDAAGTVRLSYSLPFERADNIYVWVDRNVNNQRDTGEEQVRVEATWSTAGGALSWLALGDSYSAGVGADVTNTDPACWDKASNAYSSRATSLAQADGRNVVFTSLACIGAVAADITSRNQPATSRSPQVDYVRARQPKLATLTIGGNDLGFGPNVMTCVLTDALSFVDYCPVDPDKARLVDQQPGERASWDGLYDRLVETYTAVRKAQPTDGHLAVLTYPVFFADPLGQWPFWSTIRGKCGNFSMQSAQLVNAAAVRLGDVIYLASREASRLLEAEGVPGNVHFVDWRPEVVTRKVRGKETRVAFNPNGLCGETPVEMNGLTPITGTLNTFKDSFHPTDAGYRVAAGRLWAELKDDV